MRRRSRSGLVFLLLCFNFILTYGQNISGKLVDNQTGNPHSGLMLTLENTNNVVFTNNSGNFIFVNVPSGNYNLLAKVSDQLFIISTFQSLIYLTLLVLKTKMIISLAHCQLEEMFL